MNIFVFSDSMTLMAELLGGAREIAGNGSVAAIVIGSESQTQEAIAGGADKVYWLGEQGNWLIDDFVPSIIKLLADQKPDVLLAGATMRGKAVAGRVAAAMDTVAIANAKEIKLVDGSLLVTRMIYGGGAVTNQRALGDMQLITIGPGMFAASADLSRSAEVVPVERVEPLTKITKLESKPKRTGSSNIYAAKRVIGVGRGFAQRDDLQLARKLADALDAELGYTRPVTEGTPPIAEGEPYIGVSGIQIKPDLYLAVGVSGQTQHVIGVNEAKVIVCINSEPKALMFRHSDYGIVGDLYEVLPELTKALKGA